MISYNPLFKLLIDRGITKTQLSKATGFSAPTLAKMSKNEPVYLSIIDKICAYLQCDISDVIEYKPDETINPPDKGNENNV